MSDSNKKLAFECGDCGEKFRTDEYERVELINSDEKPHDFISTCPNCHHEGVNLAQWQANLLKAWSNATGPKNTENTRFNAITHGLTAKVAQFHPARPGHYTACEGCEWKDNGCGENDNRYCLKRTEIFMRHRLAAETGDIKSLKELFADTQAGAQVILENMMLAIMQDGVTLTSPKTWTDKESGRVKPVDYVENETGRIKTIIEMKAHPLLKPFIELLSKNNLSLADMMLTQKQQGEDTKLQGFLEDEKEIREEQRKRDELRDERQQTMLKIIQGSTDPLKNIKKLGTDD